MKNNDVLIYGGIAVIGVILYKSLQANVAAYQILSNNGTQSPMQGAINATGNNTYSGGYSGYGQ